MKKNQQDSIMMKCGHTANAVNSKGEPCCVICDCTEIQQNKPKIKHRKAKCIYCGRMLKSEWDLAFFKHTDTQYDEYYCGCQGWD